MKKEALPTGWKLVKFGDVVKKVSDRVDPEDSGIDRYVAGEHMETDELRIRTWGEVGDGYLGPAFQMRFLPGQVLYGSRRTYLRKVAVPDFEGICANTTFVLQSSSPELLPEFLPYVMSAESFHEHSIKQSKGSVNPYINFSDLTWYEFALPPIDEQRKIAAILGEASREANAAANAARTAEQALNAKLHAIDIETKSRCLIEDIADLERGVSYKSSDYVEEMKGRPFLNLKCVTRKGTFSSRGIKWVRSEFAPGNIVSPGELFFANTDLTPGRLLVGAPFFFRGLDYPGSPSFSMDLTRVHMKNNGVPLEILYHLLNIPRVRSQMRSLTGGSTVGHLRLSGVPKIDIPRLENPHQILDELKSIEVVVSLLEQHSEASRALVGTLRERLLQGGTDV